ncbi:MAG: acyloxyacyl hydrolase [Bacteroidia bacterium]|nr:acyloxyacyl hydrolase [Bacteroidia bacterium]
MKSRVCIIIFPFFLLVFSFSASAQDERAQMPPALCNSYFEVNIGSINYPFDEKQLEDGYTFQSVTVPHTAVRLVLCGYEFNKYLSAQISYMRPVLWVQYTYNNGSAYSESTRSVWMNVGSLTIKPQLPINDHFTIYGEGGLCIITRHGFEDPEGTPVVKDANYASSLFGGGLKYHINKKWGLMLSAAYSPENSKVKQPSTSFLSAGFSYKLLPLTEIQLEKTAKMGYIHPKQMIQIGYSSNVLGYGVNNFVSEGKIPVFWGGEAEVHHGFTINYLRNIFHGAKVFSLDWGANMSYWQSNVNKDNFFTLSVFPVLRWTFLHTNPADVYFYYSVAGPTYISKVTIDGRDTGEHFTFQDNMGTGIFFGEQRNLNVEIKIGHYSNGNIFPENESVKIPLSLNLGYTF